MRRYLLCGLLALAACSQPPASADDLRSAADDLRTADDLLVTGDMAGLGDLASAYPPGPYGNNLGDTLPNLVWEGYINPSADGIATTKPYGPYSMDDLRRSGPRYALLYAADVFCAGCRRVAQYLAANNGAEAKRVTAAGGAIFEIVGLDGMASKADLTTWVDNYRLTITSVRDPDGTYPQSDKVFMTREFNYVVDLRTMKIVFKEFGDYLGGANSTRAIANAITDILRRLAS